MRESAAVGKDNVLILSPRRTDSPTSSTSLNQYLHDYANPPEEGKEEYTLLSYYDKRQARIFRVGDRVMQIKNRDVVANGDTGVIVDITFDKIKKCIITVDFGFEVIVEYEKKELYQLELSYCQSIHKLQGSEYTTVILHLMNIHGRMLKRNLVYTGVTRAKKKLVIVGEWEAVCTAIRNDDSQCRHTMLNHWMTGDLKAA